MPQLNKEELEAQELLQTQLKPDEELLAFTRGKANKYFYIGLTKGRLILQPLKNQKDVYPISIRRDTIKALKWSGLFAILKVQFPQEDLSFSCRGRWKNRAKTMAQVYSDTPILFETSEGVISTEKRLQQVQDFQRLDLLNNAESSLKKAIELDPSLQMDPNVIHLQQQLHERGLALRVGGGFFFATMLILFGLALLGGVSLNPIGTIVFLIAGYNLWRQRPRWRVAGIVLGLFNALIFAAGFYTTDGILGALMWVANGAALTLVLTGQSQRWRTLTAIGIYVVGFVGVIGLLFIMGMVSVMLEGG